VVRLYRPNYEAAQQAVLDASTEVTPAAQQASGAIAAPAGAHNSVAATAGDASTGEPVGVYPVAGDPENPVSVTTATVSEPAAWTLDASPAAEPAPDVATAGISAYALAAKKRALASTGIAGKESAHFFVVIAACLTSAILRCVFLRSVQSQEGGEAFSRTQRAYDIGEVVLEF
jgi:hypothetical protein